MKKLYNIITIRNIFLIYFTLLFSSLVIAVPEINEQEYSCKCECEKTTEGFQDGCGIVCKYYSIKDFIELNRGKDGENGKVIIYITPCDMELLKEDLTFENLDYLFEQTKSNDKFPVLMSISSSDDWSTSSTVGLTAYSMIDNLYKSFYFEELHDLQLKDRRTLHEKNPLMPIETSNIEHSMYWEHHLEIDKKNLYRTYIAIRERIIETDDQ